MKNFEEERLRAEYSKKTDNSVDKALKLERKMKLPANMFAYTFGIVGVLLLGIGMCLAMRVIGGGDALFVVGIIVGLFGITIVSSNYPLYRLILKARKEKYASAILLALNEKRD